MLPYGLDYSVFEDRNAERLCEVERYRLIRQLRKVHRRSEPFSPVLTWLGRRLVVWGHHLEQRSAARPTSQAGSGC
jgi:hypothetical protein